MKFRHFCRVTGRQWRLNEGRRFRRAPRVKRPIDSHCISDISFIAFYTLAHIASNTE
ncbi:hypothetical protein BURPS1655_A2151 [Burkholderia pseudomallei 1655]|nr:hypothetical protein BURPS1655_A2151 [Burkholderia pseudomallei 1655]